MKNRGITLIELMISLIISFFLLNSVIAIYLAAQKNKQAQEALMTLQENGRLVAELMTASIRAAGYIGCARNQDFPIIIKLKPYDDVEKKPHSDGITIVRASYSKAKLLSQMKHLTTLQVAASALFSQGNKIIISDCKTAEIAMVKKSMQYKGIQVIETTQPLNKLYTEKAELYLLEIDHYYIAETERKDRKGLPIYALYKKESDAHKLELVEGVSDLKIFYAVLENNALKDFPGREVLDWKKVVGVTLEITLVSLNDFSLQKTFYRYVALRE